MLRNVYQPPSYWEAYNRPYKQYRYITDPKPYHIVRELEMDKINREKQLEKFKKRVSEVPIRDYTDQKHYKVNGTHHDDNPSKKKDDGRGDDISSTPLKEANSSRYEH